MDPDIRITWRGKHVLTVEQAAERYGLAPKSVSAMLSRDGIEHDAMLDGKKKLYLVARLDRHMRNRPGHGNWGGETG